MKEDPASLLCLYHALLALRGSREALSIGGYEPVSTEGDVLAYRREHGDDRLLVVLNLGSKPREFTGNIEGTVLLSCHGDRKAEWIDGDVRLEPDQGLIIELASA